MVELEDCEEEIPKKNGKGQRAGEDMIIRTPPESWFWSHDIDPRYLDDMVTPGTRMHRLSNYGKGDRRRFAAVVFREPGAERSCLVDIDASAIETHLHQSGARPVAVTVDADDSRRFSLLLEKGPGPVTGLHVDLDEASVRNLLDDRRCLADFATYAVEGVRRYAVIVEERPGPSWLLTDVTAQELDGRS